MILLIIFAAMLVGGILWSKRLDRWDDWEIAAWVMSIIGGVLLIISLVTIPVSRMAVESKILQFEAIQKTAEVARKSGDGYEGAAFRLRIAEVNAAIVSAQYYNQTIFDVWIPDEVDQLEPID